MTHRRGRPAGPAAEGPSAEPPAGTAERPASASEAPWVRKLLTLALVLGPAYLLPPLLTSLSLRGLLPGGLTGNEPGSHALQQLVVVKHEVWLPPQ